MSTLLQELTARYGMDGADSLLEDKDFGVVNGHITANIFHSNVVSFRGLYAPPYASSNFSFDGWVCGQAVKTTSYSWLPFQVRRQGVLPGLEISSVTTLIEGERALAFELNVHNVSGSHKKVPLKFDINGGLDYPTEWLFAWPTGDKAVYTSVEEDGLIVRRNDTGVMAIGAEGLSREGYVPFWNAELSLENGESKSFWFTLAIGAEDTTIALARELLRNPAAAVKKNCEAWAERASELLGRFPKFTAADKRLEKFYDRSALHLLINQWLVSEFVLNPYYATGAINGGCVVSYLWDFGEGWEFFSLLDPDATREHIKAFLATDLTRHFAFNPMSGAGWGPWYYVNQEKIVLHVYYYVLHTGDVAFLNETVKGKTILDLVLHHTVFGDRLEEEANLIDYGIGNHHLELRRQYRYDNYLPDVNARRYPSYLAAETLFKLAGKEPPVDFRDRAEKLKALIHEKMWSEDDKWWYHLDPEGDKHLNFNMQLLKLIGGGAISDEEQDALVAHINEKEFLGEFGVHSMSKLDVAYDQVDIDNGGGGAYTSFPPMIAEKLYKAGYPAEGEDILRRILWWGERLPYWGDSIVANIMDYRKDTPLQSIVGAIAGAQAIVFGMFGVLANADGSITINPVPPSYSSSIAIKGLHIRGKLIDVEVANGQYKVTAGDDVYSSAVGEPVIVPAG